MRIYSAVAYSFTNENWKKLCEAGKTDKRAQNKHCSFDELLEIAYVNQDHPDGKHHVVYWTDTVWYECEHETAISFLQDVGKKLCSEYIYIDDKGGYDYSFKEGERNYFLRDGDEIEIVDITLANYKRANLLVSAVKAFMEAAPESAREWRATMGKWYGCYEFDQLFEEA